MEFEVKKQKILDVMQKHRLAVISTVTSSNRPEAALIGYNHLETLELVFRTFTSFRKYKNVLENPHVAFVIGWDDNITVQYEGVAQELRGSELYELQKKYLGKFNADKKHISNSEERFFIVKPTWIRYTNLSDQPEEILEVKF